MGLPGAMRLIVAVGLLVLTVGCAMSQSEAVSRSRSAYDAGMYAEAFRDAAAVADDPRVPVVERQEAAYMAGAAAYQLQRYHDAQRYFEIAAQSRDDALSGDANAMLGLVHSRLGRYNLAARMLLEAAPKLQGQDRANAYFYAGVAQQRLGRWPESRTSLSLARTSSTDAAFRQRIAEQMAVTGYTLQVGAFANENNARRAAGNISEQAQASRLGSPRVVPATAPEGGNLYLVQVGQFYSWPTAISARERLQSTAAIVVPLSR